MKRRTGREYFSSAEINKEADASSVQRRNYREMFRPAASFPREAFSELERDSFPLVRDESDSALRMQQSDATRCDARSNAAAFTAANNHFHLAFPRR